MALSGQLDNCQIPIWYRDITLHRKYASRRTDTMEVK